MSGAAPWLLLPFLLLPAADQAQLLDGKRVSGALGLDERGQLSFAVERSNPVHADRIALVRFAPTDLPLFRVPGGLHLVLRGGQSLTGALVRLDGESVMLRTAWAERLKLPRDAVIALTQLPGWQPLFEDDSWKDLAWTPLQPLEAGRVGVNFQETRPVRRGRWLMELHFQHGDQVQVLRVTLAGPGDGYTAEMDGLKGAAEAVERTTGWHRLTVQWGPRSLRVLVDDRALWYNLERGPAGPLRRVRLVRPEDVDRDSLAVAAFAVAKAVPDLVRPEGDPTQDEVWLATGDQLFGQVAQADGQSLTIQGRYGKRTLPWTEVRGLYLCQPPRRVPVPPGGGVRLWLNNGLTPQTDVLEGELQGMDGNRLKLRHAWLGEVDLERRWLKQLQPLSR
jgi:hypothetical protein